MLDDAQRVSHAESHHVASQMLEKGQDEARKKVGDAVSRP